MEREKDKERKEGKEGEEGEEKGGEEEMKKIGLAICVAAIVVACFGFLTGCEQSSANESRRHLYVISAVDCKVLLHEVGNFYIRVDGGGVVSYGPYWNDGSFCAGANMVFVTKADLNLKIGDVFTSFSPVVKGEK